MSFIGVPWKYSQIKGSVLLFTPHSGYGAVSADTTVKVLKSEISQSPADQANSKSQQGILYPEL